jgi:hypothetical protein
MTVDLCAALLRKRPDPWLDGDLDPIKRGDLNSLGQFHDANGTLCMFFPDP